MRHCTMRLPTRQSSGESAFFKPFIGDRASGKKMRDAHKASHPARFVIRPGESPIRFDLEIESTSSLDCTGERRRGEPMRVGCDAINATGEKHAATQA